MLARSEDLILCIVYYLQQIYSYFVILVYLSVSDHRSILVQLLFIDWVYKIVKSIFIKLCSDFSWLKLWFLFDWVKLLFLFHWVKVWFLFLWVKLWFWFLWQIYSYFVILVYLSVSDHRSILVQLLFIDWVY
jgi:hypothetical protein